MADLDTREKRASGMNPQCPWRGCLPLPDGAIGQADRQQTDISYCGILATALVSSNAVTYRRWGIRMSHRPTIT